MEENKNDLFYCCPVMFENIILKSLKPFSEAIFDEPNVYHIEDSLKVMILFNFIRHKGFLVIIFIYLFVRIIRQRVLLCI